jgi:hypothetical protein
MKMIKTIACLLIIGMIFCSCSKRNKISEEKFVGDWELKGRSSYEGIQVRIKIVDKKIKGRILKLNNNKIVRMFMDSDAVFVAEIKRVSNFEFKLTEKKPAAELFSMYNQSTSQEFKVEFIDDNKIGLVENGDPKKSSVFYERVK